MSSCRELAAGVLLAAAGIAAAQPAAYPGIGRPATPREIQAGDVDVRPDFKGLPAGAGSVAKGMQVWEAKCASCHGIFGESNEVFSPLVGGTTQDDIRNGRAARLTDAAYPGRTTLMKLTSVSTLWDYINRAMPWTQPKSLSVEEVYAVTAYLLNLGGVLPDDFVLSDRNIGQAQQRLPNRNGITLDHALWPGQGFGRARRPDASGVACMSRCATEPTVASFIPEHARGAHGNLAEQNRLIGPQRGAETRPAGAPAPAPARPGAEPAGAAALALAQRHACIACHGVETRIVGPGFKEVAGRYAGRPDAEAYLAGKIKSGGQGVWGQIPMPAQALPDAEARVLAAWLAAGAGP